MGRRKWHNWTGNPNTNDAGRYSAAVKRWEAGGRQGPRPDPADFGLGPEPDGPPSPADVKRQRAAIKAQARARQRKLID
jgi:hypothetical protein